MLKIRSVDFGQQQFQIHQLNQCYPGQMEWIIGRNITSDLVLQNPEVSRMHGRIFYRDSSYYFEDTGSKCGSILNGEKISSEQNYPIYRGDLLQIGDIFLHIEDLSPPSFAPAESEQRVVVLPQAQHWAAADLAVRCSRVVDETPDTKTFYFMADPPILFDYQPGQFVNLEVEIDGKPVIRPYSISSSPTRPYHLSLTIKRVGRPADRPDLPAGLVSNWLHDHLKVGDWIKLVGGAMGQFTCLPELRSKLLLISAGSGITPMMSMARWVHDAIADCDIVFLYSAPTPDDIPFRSELETMATQMPNFQLAVTITRPNNRTSWMGLTGRISKSMLHLVTPDLLERTTYVCGSDPFMQSIKATLEAMNFPMQNYREESFGGKPTNSSSPKAGVVSERERVMEKLTLILPDANTDTKVCFAQSNKTLLADGNTSILELAEQEGIPIRQHCRMGACGACKVFTRQGKVRYDMQPTALTYADQEAGYALACIAYPVEELVVEA